MTRPPAVIRLRPWEHTRLAELARMPTADLKALYLACSKRRSPATDGRMDSFLSRETMSELIIWHERPPTQRTRR